MKRARLLLALFPVLFILTACPEIDAPLPPIGSQTPPKEAAPAQKPSEEKPPSPEEERPAVPKEPLLVPYPVYQLERIIEGSQAMYDVRETLGSPNLIKLVSFLRLEDRNRARLQISVFDHFRLSYLVELYYAYHLLGKRITLEATTLREASFADGLFRAFRNSTYLSHDENASYVPADLLRQPHTLVAEFFGFHFHAGLPKSLEMEIPKDYGALRFPLSEDKSRSYVFLPANNPAFQVGQKQNEIAGGNIFRQISAPAVYRGASIRVYRDGANELNGNPTDDVYYVEPLAWIEDSNGRLFAHVSEAKAYELVQGETNSVPQGSLKRLPNLSEVRITEGKKADRAIDSAWVDEDPVEVTLPLPSGSEKTTVWVHFMDEAGESILSRELSNSTEPET
ncbi:MAG TPA: hypothetical protein VI895_08020 [Bdellovibrionota bacterium]|nr:hypothetical protein [Bdellovibrionota bacterium]